jgi:hypothetical protein
MLDTVSRLNEENVDWVVAMQQLRIDPGVRLLSHDQQTSDKNQTWMVKASSKKEESIT